MRTDNEFIDFLHKELVEMMYNREISGDTMLIFHKIIAKWREAGENVEEKGHS